MAIVAQHMLAAEQRGVCGCRFVDYDPQEFVNPHYSLHRLAAYLEFTIYFQDSLFANLAHLCDTLT